ncbi:hypothetical protein ILYODFUR_037465 [Ilyodon furcidens]|uniref:Uncharacterized protein n=1 Tax=Ilyodon furcidens TaxID=33524 RepID=A0ABV0STS3_9TELE
MLTFLALALFATEVEMDKKGQKLMDRQEIGTKVVKHQRKRKTQNEECYSPSGSYTDNRVKIGPNTWNGLMQGIPYLKLPSGLVLLDKPRADFAPYYPSSESYVVSNIEYHRKADLQKPDHAGKCQALPWNVSNFFLSYRKMSWPGNEGRHHWILKL